MTPRADAAKNRKRLVTKARRLFSTAGGPTSLEAIAQAAGVGIGTLYRHFPTKEALVEAVYQRELDALDRKADDLLSAHRSFDAMRLWMDRYARFVVTKHAMHDALRISLSPGSGPLSEIRARISATIAKFLAAGSSDGSIRTDVLPEDLTLSIAGAVFAATAALDRGQVSRILDLLASALRPRS
jgi:AcrR family transcriptional regulator